MYATGGRDQCMEAKPNHADWEQPPEFPQLCRFLAERSPQCMVAVEGLSHIVRYANPAFRRLLGKEEQHLVGRLFGEAVPEGMANGCAPLLDRVFTTGIPELLAEQVHRPRDADKIGAGVEAYWSYSVWPITGPVVNPAGSPFEQPAGVMIQVTDSTEIATFRVRAAAVNEALLLSGVRQHELAAEAHKLTLDLRQSEVQERAARQEAEAANRSKDLFLATLSHELRTPLNAIVGWTSILQSDDCTDEDLKEGLEVIQRNCMMQAQLIEDILDMSRIVSGNLRLHTAPCDLSAVIHAAMDVVRLAAEAKGLRLQASIDPTACSAACDASRMQQVVWNLLTNAIKFTPKGGQVSVTLTREPSSTRITITDTGQGIAADFLPHVFDRFRQADSTTRRKFGGLGLGLSIVQEIVQLHGGTVRATSAGPGTGATFTIDLPIRALRALQSLDHDPFDGEDGDSVSRLAETTEPLAPASPRPTASRRLNGVRVLVVDDETDARRLVAKVLHDAGASVTALASAPEAVAAVESSDAMPQVLVSDIGMPEMDGFELIRRVRELGHTLEQLPAVALTAFAHPDDERRALLAGFQMHLSKPVDPLDLVAVVGSLAGRTAGIVRGEM